MTLKTGVKWSGKPNNTQRRHPVLEGIQQRLRRASLINKDTLKLISQNINGLSTTNHHKREEIFHKFSNKKYDVALLQECYTYINTGSEDFIINNSTRFISHSQHARRGGLGFLLSTDAQTAWRNAGEYIRYRSIDGVTRISTIQLSYNSGQYNRRYHIINVYFPTSDAVNTTHFSTWSVLSRGII
uniref:Endonuclease/exonuclease/phosphatase domain-containing protein n=1 Tax=Leptocylindrus danicus TaxID=163516 RepID=A0A7S2L8A1_9STRA|mmetsp:Transcript_32549/g.47148  ORF Transcript_32549/g.47148 Transcript_32549/m.47148 type:complete len:186 (+) Transcript_32549:210-767(+)